MTRTVVVHDGTSHPGGAVDVAIEAARALDGDLVVGFSEPDQAWWEARAPNDVRVLSQPGRVLNDVRNAVRMRRLALSEYELVMTSGPATKFYRPFDDQRRIHYLHHPPLGSLWADSKLAGYARSALDRLETLTIPVIIANSELTADRCFARYGREVDAVVNPPVYIDDYAPSTAFEQGRFVMVGRLEERKRPRLAVDAFNRLVEEGGPEPPRLDLIGEGPLRAELERLAGPTVTFHGYVDDDRLVELIKQAHAGVFLAKREDFGIAPVEYLAAGLPVLAVDEPNTNNQIDDGVNGVLVEPEVSAVTRGIETILEGEWDRMTIAESATGFGPDRFHRELEAVIDGL